MNNMYVLILSVACVRMVCYAIATVDVSSLRDTQVFNLSVWIKKICRRYECIIRTDSASRSGNFPDVIFGFTWRKKIFLNAILN
jgi:hypothetical protein